MKEQNRHKYKTNDEVRASKRKQSKAKYSSCPKFQEDLKSRSRNNYMNEEFKEKKKEYNKMRYKTRREVKKKVLDSKKKKTSEA